MFAVWCKFVIKYICECTNAVVFRIGRHMSNFNFRIGIFLSILTSFYFISSFTSIRYLSIAWIAIAVAMAITDGSDQLIELIVWFWVFFLVKKQMQYMVWLTQRPAIRGFNYERILIFDIFYISYLKECN